jgi:predicted enzyme related to lactoylglutathione lyase
MAKLRGPDFFNLQVRDIAVSRAFYVDLLGLPVDPRFNVPGTVAFDTATIPFALAQATLNLDEAPQAGWGVALWFDCDDIDGLYTKLQAAGTIIIRPPFDSPFGRAMVFQDPDGYQLTANKNDWDRFPLGGKFQSSQSC